jgi:hypothetical protein
VWAEVVKLIGKHPDLNETQLLQQAIGAAGVQALDLTAEDWRLLEMAIEWRKNGIKGVALPRIGGAPGGPANTSTGQAFGHELGSRGAP